MSRRIIKEKSFIIKDIKYNSFLVNFLINKVLKNGKKSIAKKIVYNALNLVELKMKKNSLFILETAIKNISPIIKIIPFYHNQTIYFEPKQLEQSMSIKIAITWLIKSAFNRSGKKIEIKLCDEIIDTYKNIGQSVKKKDLFYKKIESSKVIFDVESDIE